MTFIEKYIHPTVYSIRYIAPVRIIMALNHIHDLRTYVFILWISGNHVEKKSKVKKMGANRSWRPTGCDTSRLPHFLHNRPTDGAKFVSLTRRPLFTPRKIPAAHFC
jgi:hypothetical protein